MRKRRLPIGWPRRDPRHYRFPLPNTVWDYRLKPIEFMILSYLCCCRSHKHGNVKTAAEAIADAVHLTAGTVKKYLSSLVDKGLATNEYVPSFQCADNRKFFTLPNEIFLLNLPPSAFVVYAYLLLIEDRNTHTCHPSYNTIAAATHLTRNTVINSITVLLGKELIAMEHSSYFDQHGMKWKGNNLYTILPTQAAVDQFHQRQLHQLELGAERRRVRKRQERFARDRPHAAPSHESPRSAL